ncbi:hypothetical protein NL676_026064 [Syzygium grande]|nr:hypothetical protein NL676_026064 [Syzygium grande]
MQRVEHRFRSFFRRDFPEQPALRRGARRRDKARPAARTETVSGGARSSDGRGERRDRAHLLAAAAAAAAEEEAAAATGTRGRFEIAMESDEASYLHCGSSSRPTELPSSEGKDGRREDKKVPRIAGGRGPDSLRLTAVRDVPGPCRRRRALAAVSLKCAVCVNR